MGDVAMTVPVLKALTEQHPTIKITILTKPFFKPFFRGLPNITVFSLDAKGKHKGIYGLYKLANQLNRENDFYAIADLHNVLRSKILKFFLKSVKVETIDKGRKEKTELISGKFFAPLKTTSQRYVNVFEQLGFLVDLSKSTFPAKAKLNERLKTIIGNTSLKLIGIAPFAAHESKMYPLDLMELVIENLSKEHSILLFGGGKKEIDILNGFEASYENVVNVSDKVSFEEELDLISNLNVMLSMDSGNAHIAAMLGIKVITIWGVTHPYAGFAPFNQPEDYALLSDRNKFPKIPTSVYGNKYPKNYKEASRSISPEMVIEKIKAVI